MKQYKEHLEAILAKGTHKPAARENMPGTTSLFGHQWRHDLSEGFPLLTTKKTYWKGIVIELLWFLKGDTNVKYLNDNGVTFWNEDAYNYYKKIHKKYNLSGDGYNFEEFVQAIKEQGTVSLAGLSSKTYKLGDCGFQYGRVWRKWQIIDDTEMKLGYWHIDQIVKLIKQLKNNPESRRHILTSIDPANDENLALYWCHALTQFNCRPIKKGTHINGKYYPIGDGPDYFLDCQMYQRSADMFLGVPLNIASYALLTHILAKVCGMEPGEMIYSYGDSHIYDNHIEQIKEQLTREERPLPTLKFSNWFNNSIEEDQPNTVLDEWINSLKTEDFIIENYNPHPPIKGELSTGLIK